MFNGSWPFQDEVECSFLELSNMHYKQNRVGSDGPVLGKINVGLLLEDILLEEQWKLSITNVGSFLTIYLEHTCFSVFEKTFENMIENFGQVATYAQKMKCLPQQLYIFMNHL